MWEEQSELRNISTFLLIPGVLPWGVGGWMGGSDTVTLGVGNPTHVCMCTHMHACTCLCADTCMHIKHDKHGSHLQFPNMFILVFCVCVCVHMIVHVHMSRDTPMPPDAPHPSAPSPRAAGSLNHQKSISPEPIKIIQFCLKILYLWTLLYLSGLITSDTPTYLPHP